MSEHPTPSTSGAEGMWLILTLEEAALGDTCARVAERWFWWNHNGFPSKCSWVGEIEKLLLETIFYTPAESACRLQALSLRSVERTVLCRLSSFTSTIVTAVILLQTSLNTQIHNRIRGGSSLNLMVLKLERGSKEVGINIWKKS